MDADALRTWLTGPTDTVGSVDLDAAEAMRVAERAGWQTRHLSTTPGTDKAALLRECQRALDLPEHFGHNWDALADSLRDVRADEDRAGLLVAWSGSTHLPAHVRDTMLDLLTERCRLRPGFAVVLLQR